MKKIIVLAVLLSSIVFSQENNSTTPFSNFNFGVYGGINFVEVSEVGGAFCLEGKTNVTSNLNLIVSFGYYKLVETVNYTIRGSGHSIIDTIKIYYAAASDISQRVYDVIPISFGLQYIFRNETISPYIELNGSYNFIDYKRTRNGDMVWFYSTYEEVPVEFKNYQPETIPKESFGVAIGIGALFNIKKKVDIDFRYMFKYDNEIINSHQILIGIII